MPALAQPQSQFALAPGQRGCEGGVATGGFGAVVGERVTATGEMEGFGGWVVGKRVAAGKTGEAVAGLADVLAQAQEVGQSPGQTAHGVATGYPCCRPMASLIPK